MTDKIIYEWRKHPRHGFMLRVISDDAWCFVVTSLLANNLDVEKDETLWRAQGSRLDVNAGSGQIAADLMRKSDVNPAFKVVPEGSVPQHIKNAFMALAED